MHLKTEKLSHSKRSQYFLSFMKAGEQVGRTARPLLPVQHTSEHIRTTSLSTPLKPYKVQHKNVPFFSRTSARNMYGPDIHPVTLHERKIACRSS